MSERYTPEQMAENADWGQVVCNGGPPCFHAEGNRFCLRAERWPGHASGSYEADHKFVSLAELLRSQAATDAEALAAKDERIAALIHERDVLQRISARRAGALERVGLHADCTMEEATALALTGDATEGQG